MADANCPIHGTPFNGFGNFTFCNECDTENAAQAIHDEDKEGSLQDMHLADEKDCIDGHGNLLPRNKNFQGNTLNSCTVSAPSKYGWLIFGQQLPSGQYGTGLVQAGQEVHVSEPTPGANLGAIYRIQMAQVTVIPHMLGVVRVLNDSPAVLMEQVLYMRDGRKYIGINDVGPWDMPDP